MGWKASTLSLLGTEDAERALVAKRIARLALGLSLLALAVIAILAVGSRVEIGPSSAAVAGMEASSARWTAAAQAYTTNPTPGLNAASARWSAIVGYYGEDAVPILDEANLRWSAVAAYFGKDVGFILDEVNPRWSVVADYFGSEDAFIPQNTVISYWGAVADYFATEEAFIRQNTVSSYWGVVADNFASEDTFLPHNTVSSYWGAVADYFASEDAFIPQNTVSSYWGDVADYFASEDASIPHNTVISYWGVVAGYVFGNSEIQAADSVVAQDIGENASRDYRHPPRGCAAEPLGPLSQLTVRGLDIRCCPDGKGGSRNVSPSVSHRVLQSYQDGSSIRRNRR